MTPWFEEGVVCSAAKNGKKWLASAVVEMLWAVLSMLLFAFEGQEREHFVQVKRMRGGGTNAWGVCATVVFHWQSSRLQSKLFTSIPHFYCCTIACIPHPISLSLPSLLYFPLSRVNCSPLYCYVTCFCSAFAERLSWYCADWFKL